MKLTHSQLIDLLGGTNKVARLCKVSMGSVTHWRTRQIPTGQLLFLAATIEKETKNLVTRRDLFPDNYGTVWPELVENNLSKFVVEKYDVMDHL